MQLGIPFPAWVAAPRRFEGVRIAPQQLRAVYNGARVRQQADIECRSSRKGGKRVGESDPTPSPLRPIWPLFEGPALLVCAFGCPAVPMEQALRGWTDAGDHWPPSPRVVSQRRRDGTLEPW